MNQDMTDWLKRANERARIQNEIGPKWGYGEDGFARYNQFIGLQMAAPDGVCAAGWAAEIMREKTGYPKEMDINKLMCDRHGMEGLLCHLRRG